MTPIERIKAGLESDTPGRVEWRTLLETALFEIERIEESKRHFSALADAKGKENVGLRAENEALIATLKEPDQVGYWQRRCELAEEKLRAILRDARDHVPYDVLARIDAALAKNPAS